MTAFSQAERAALKVRSLCPLRSTIGVVLGSGLGAFAGTLEERTVIPYAEIPHFPVSTAVGHRGELVLGLSRGTPVIAMSGRAHLYEGYSPDQVVFPVRVLGRLGVRILIVTNAAGAIRTDFRPGEFMVITDHINFMGLNPLAGPAEEGVERFFDMSEAYDRELQQIAIRACQASGVVAREGVYIAFPGPSYETPAEIKMARSLGADAVGMSTVPEVLAARQLGIRVLALSCLTNMAAGVLHKNLDHKEVLEVGERTKDSLLQVLRAVIEEASKLS